MMALRVQAGLEEFAMSQRPLFISLTHLSADVRKRLEDKARSECLTLPAWLARYIGKNIDAMMADESDRISSKPRKKRTWLLQDRKSIAAREDEAARLYATGMSQFEVAAQMDISRSSVSTLLSRYNRRHVQE